MKKVKYFMVIMVGRMFAAYSNGRVLDALALWQGYFVLELAFNIHTLFTCLIFSYLTLYGRSVQSGENWIPHEEASHGPRDETNNPSLARVTFSFCSVVCASVMH